MDYACTQCSRLFVHYSRLHEGAIESPIDINAPFARVSQHPHEPLLYRAAVKIFDDVKNSQRLLYVPNCLLRPDPSCAAMASIPRVLCRTLPLRRCPCPDPR